MVGIKNVGLQVHGNGAVFFSDHVPAEDRQELADRFYEAYDSEKYSAADLGINSPTIYDSDFMTISYFVDPGKLREFLENV